MRVKFVELQNFRRLESVRIDFAKETTLLVGANNSGKTSAMEALGHFLVDKNRFTTKDFTLSAWNAANKIGVKWCAPKAKGEEASPLLSEWSELLPSMDIWLDVADDEIHHVSHMLPTLEWKGGLLGIRLRLEPNSIEELFSDFVNTTKAARDTVAAATEATKKEGKADKVTLELWPRSMEHFLGRRLKRHFIVRAYTLDPQKCVTPKKGVAMPQSLPAASDPLEGDPFRGLIRIDLIRAQRGFSDVTEAGTDDGDGEPSSGRSGQRLLSDQLRGYYKKHLDPSDLPEASDVPALQAIESAQKSFDLKLKDGFKSALQELEGLGYPGVTDPRLSISTRLQPIEGLKHSSAVEYDVLSRKGAATEDSLRLPEQYNGLGYQNLISIVFKLMSFRDEWMQVGKAGKKVLAAEPPGDPSFQPLHLVLIEEPEAHLHAQVQQVFFRKAYDVLRNHSSLGKSELLTTQLVLSTHSSHIAHECKFEDLRYFRRQPASGKDSVPTSTVVNLSDVFGKGEDTSRFVTRYLKATHCDLFFADAAILVEGPAERMLVPLFIRTSFRRLNECYVTVLEIGGSHAHRLKPLIEELGLTTLVITDLDAIDATPQGKAAQPERGKNQKSGNATLGTWLPKETGIDKLLGLDEKSKIESPDSNFSIRVAYQTPIKTRLKDGGSEEEALPYTFEDSLVFHNLDLFKKLDGTGLVKEFKEAISSAKSIPDLGRAMFDILRTGKKARFALDLLYQEPKDLNVPNYILEGLGWLERQLKKKQEDILGPTAAAEAKAIGAKS